MSLSVSGSRCCIKARGRAKVGARVCPSLSSLASRRCIVSGVVSWVTLSCRCRLVNEGEGKGKGDRRS